MQTYIINEYYDLMLVHINENNTNDGYYKGVIINSKLDVISPGYDIILNDEINTVNDIKLWEKEVIVPLYEGMLVRLFYYDDEWITASLKKIDDGCKTLINKYYDNDYSELDKKTTYYYIISNEQSVKPIFYIKGETIFSIDGDESKIGYVSVSIIYSRKIRMRKFLIKKNTYNIHNRVSYYTMLYECKGDIEDKNELFDEDLRRLNKYINSTYHEKFIKFNDILVNREIYGILKKMKVMGITTINVLDYYSPVFINDVMNKNKIYF